MTQQQPPEAISRPDPKVNGYIDVRYKNGEPKRIEFDVEYFVDDWFTMGFAFRVKDNTAELRTITPPGDRYNPRQSSDAREEAIRQVTSFDFVDTVDMHND